MTGLLKVSQVRTQQSLLSPQLNQPDSSGVSVRHCTHFGYICVQFPLYKAGMSAASAASEYDSKQSELYS